MDKKLLRFAERGDAAQLSRLVSEGVSVAGTDKKGNTLLHYAALANSVESCAILIAGGCNIHDRNIKGQTAAELADLKKKKRSFAWLRQQEASESAPKLSAKPSSSTSTSSENKSTESPAWNLTSPQSIEASVNVLRYDQSDWQPISPDSTLSLVFTPHPNFSFVLSAYKDSEYFIKDDLKSEYIYKSSALATFYNYVGSGDIFGFEFHEEEIAQKFSDLVLFALDTLANPPDPLPKAEIQEPDQPAPQPPTQPAPQPPTEEVDETLATEAPVAPPAPPGPPGPPPPPAPKVVTMAKGGSLADQLSSNKLQDGGIRPAKAAGPTDMMSELQNRLKRRSTAGNDFIVKSVVSDIPTPPQTNDEDSPRAKGLSRSTSASAIKRTTVQKKPSLNTTGPVKPFASRPTEADLNQFKLVVIEGFRKELTLIKDEIIASIRVELETLQA